MPYFRLILLDRITFETENVNKVYSILLNFQDMNVWLFFRTENKVRFHPNSVMHENATSKLTVGENHYQTVQSLPTDWLIYEEMTR